MSIPDPRLLAVVEDMIARALDPAAPGYGQTDYPTAGPADIPKAYAMIVKASALDAGRTPVLAALAQTSENWLLAHADEDADGVKGWGLPFEWDAFGDGTANPANTEYAISTAIAVDALLDRANTLTGQPRAEILQLSWQALSPYLDPAVATPGGMAPYSLTAQDRPWDVFNTAAYLAAAAQRLSNAEVTPGQAQQLRSFAGANMQALLDHRLLAADGAWYWPYLQPGSGVNDLPHAAYIIYSIETYVREGGQLADSFDRAAIWSHLSDFVGADIGYVRAYPDFVSIDSPARSYDVGFALATLSLGGDPLPDVREHLIATLSSYRLNDGHYAKYPVSGPAAVSDHLVVTEYETYFLFGSIAGLADPEAIRYLYGDDISLMGSDNSDTLIGNAGSNILTALSGDDILVGNNGNDSLDGGDDSDRLEGGDGDDLLIAGSGLWTDVLVGGTGDDIYELYNVSSQVYESPGEGRDTVRSYAWSTMLWDNVEDLDLLDPRNDTDGIGNALGNVMKGNIGGNRLNGVSGNDILIGNAGNDTLDGGDGADTLNGGEGNDTLLAGSGLWTDVLVGSTGDDIYEIYNVASQVYENPSEGRDTVRSYAWSTTLWDNVEDLELVDPRSDTDGIGNALGNVIKGNIGGNRLSGVSGNDILIGNAGNDTLDGGDGADTLNGGEGNDTLLAGSGLWTDVLVGSTGDDIYELYNAASLIYENPSEGIDTLRSYAWATTLPKNVENLMLVDPVNHVDGTGNALNNLLTGNAGNNVMTGLGGSDTLTGGLGQDTFLLRPGDGGSVLTLADVITDYQDGTDFIGLGGGLAYADLTIAQGTGANADDTLIRISGGEYLAILQNVSAFTLDILDFCLC